MKQSLKSDIILYSLEYNTEKSNAPSYYFPFFNKGTIGCKHSLIKEIKKKYVVDHRIIEITKDSVKIFWTANRSHHYFFHLRKL